MKVLCCLIGILIVVVVGQTTIPANNPNFQYIGRFDFTNPAGPRFDWSDCQIAGIFSGTSLTVLINDNGNEYDIWIDGTLVYIMNTTGIGSYKVASGLSAGNHQFLIVKRTEAFFGIVTFNGIVLDNGQNLQPPPARPTRRIEFLGDSITCGYGDEGTFPCSFNAATENVYRAYGPLTARALNADIHVESWSGKGVVRNYGDANITSVNPFPIYWNRTLAENPNGNYYDFDWVPDAIVINLGTNDYSTNPIPPENVFVPGYQNYIKAIRTAYAPANPTIFLACGPLIGNPCCTYVQAVVGNDTTLTFIDLENILSFPKDYGCDYHPNILGHSLMANITIPIVAKTMGWNFSLDEIYSLLEPFELDTKISSLSLNDIPYNPTQRSAAFKG